MTQRRVGAARLLRAVEVLEIEGEGDAGPPARLRRRPDGSRGAAIEEIGGLGELVEEGVTGLLVPPGEADPLAQAIVQLARDLPRAAEMGEAGRRRALEQFLQERCTDRTELLYRDQLESRGRNGTLPT